MTLPRVTEMMEQWKEVPPAHRSLMALVGARAGGSKQEKKGEQDLSVLFDTGLFGHG